MKRVLHFFSLIFFLSIINNALYAQNIKEFQKDSTLFIEQFKEFTERNISVHEEDSLKSFVEKWNTNYFSEDVKNRFIDICNLMLSKKASRDPYFTKYFDIVMAFHQSEKAMKHYDNWEKGLIYIFETERYPLKIVTNYFKNSKTLIQDNLIFSTYSTSWHTSSDEYEFIVDNVLKIKFKKTNLTCKIKTDSINIFETEGYYYPISHEWHGKDGYVTWERAGYSADSVNAVFIRYKINFKKSGYEVDSAIFTNKFYFSEPILGKISDQVTHIMSSDKAIYPEFNSYQKRFKIKNIYPDIDYNGGFAMKGSNLLGSGDKDNNASLYIHKNDTIILSAISKTFMFKKDRAISNNAQITIHFDNDSIYHPGILFTYLKNKREISLNPSDRIVSKSPYYNSYHNISMNFDRLLWQIDSDKIFLTKKRSTAIGNATYTSSNFYTIAEFEKIMMRDDFHPLITIKNYAKRIQSEQFYGEDLARFLGYDDYQIKQMLMFLSVDGFIFYDTDKDEAIIKKKLY